MIFQGTVRNPLGDQGRDGDDAAVVQGKDVVLAPHFAKKDIIIVAGKIRCELAELLPAGSLYDFYGFLFIIFHVTCSLLRHDTAAEAGQRQSCTKKFLKHTSPPINAASLSQCLQFHCNKR